MGSAAISYGPKLGLLNNAAIGEAYYDQLRPFLRGVDALVQARVISTTTVTPPASPGNGDAYLLPSTGLTGAWVGHGGQIAVYSTQITETGNNTLTPGWDFYTPQTGWTLYASDLAELVYYTGSAWEPVASGGGGGMTNPMTTEGDIIIGASSGTPARLAAGTSGYVLTSNGSGAEPSWQAAGGGGSGFGNGEASLTAPVLSSFTEDNFGESTTASTITPGGITAVLLSDPGLSGNNNALRSLLVSIPTPGSPWTLTARLRFDTVLTNFMSFGIVLKDSTSGKYMLFGWGADVGIIQEVDFNNANSFNTDFNVFPSIYGSSFPTEGWWRWQYDGTNLNYLWSRDGNAFALLRQTALGSIFLPNAPSEAGIGLNANNNITESPINPMNLLCFSFSLTQP